MNKISELLKKYYNEKNVSSDIYYDSDSNCFMRDCLDSFYDFSTGTDEYIISKEFGFIKWLCDNKYIEEIPFDLGTYTSSDVITMYLSIESDPLHVLSRMLKENEE